MPAPLGTLARSWNTYQYRELAPCRDGEGQGRAAVLGWGQVCTAETCSPRCGGASRGGPDTPHPMLLCWSPHSRAGSVGRWTVSPPPPTALAWAHCPWVPGSSGQLRAWRWHLQPSVKVGEAKVTQEMWCRGHSSASAKFRAEKDSWSRTGDTL